MLTEAKEIEIISNARQKNVRNPKRSREHFHRIIDEFFGIYDFSGRRWLDLGPGQYDFAEIVRERGGIVDNIDNDSAVLELGAYKGFVTIEGNLKELRQVNLKHKPYDGIFCKFSINAFWFHDQLNLISEYISVVNSLIEPEAAAWIAPWNGIPKKAALTDIEIEKVLDQQRQAFISQGFTCLDITSREAKYFGINGNVANNILFTKGL